MLSSRKNNTLTLFGMSKGTPFLKRTIAVSGWPLSAAMCINVLPSLVRSNTDALNLSAKNSTVAVWPRSAARCIGVRSKHFKDFFKNGQTPASFSYIFGLFKQMIQFLQQINVNKCHVHPVYSARIKIHNLSNMSHLPSPLDQGSSPILNIWKIFSTGASRVNSQFENISNAIFVSNLNGIFIYSPFTYRFWRILHPCWANNLS